MLFLPHCSQSIKTLNICTLYIDPLLLFLSAWSQSWLHFVVLLLLGNASNLLNKGKSAVPFLFNGQEVLSDASDKAKLFAENFSKNSDLDDSGISLHVFPSRTNLKLHNISVTLKIVKKGHNESWYVKGIWSWLYCSGGSKELRVQTFVHTSSTLQ